LNRIARGLLTWSYSGEPLDQPMVAAGYYLKLTADDVQKAFQHYLQTDHMVQVVQGPAPARH
jgi:zinc protease